MLVLLFDRIWSQTVFFLILLACLLVRRDAWNATFVYGTIAACTAYYARMLYTAVKTEYNIDRLGGRAPAQRSWVPFGMGLVISSLRAHSACTSHLWWQWMLRASAKSMHPYTVEAVSALGRVILTADEENIKAILATQFHEYGKGERFRKEWKDFLGLSIFTTDGELWHNSRTLLRPQFIKDRISDLETFEHHVRVLMPLLAGSHDGATVRADDLFYRYTLDAATDFLLGRSVDSLQNPTQEFADAFAEVQRLQAIKARTDGINPWMPSFQKSLKKLNEFVGQYIDQALQLSQDELEKVGKSDEGYTFLHALASYNRDPVFLRDQLVAVLLAGRDTTAVTLSWLFYELSRNPRVVHKLRQEIMDFVGLERVPAYSDLKNMRYLQHTVNETLRLYPVVPYNVRVALQDTTLPRGGGADGSEPIAVLKDTPIGYSTYIMQNRADIYPPTSTSFPPPSSFVPERWDNWTPKSWTYIPFNGGPRICIGQQFALTELAYTVVRILQTYGRVESRQQDFPQMKTDIVLQPAKGVYVAFLKGDKA